MARTTSRCCWPSVVRYDGGAARRTSRSTCATGRPALAAPAIQTRAWIAVRAGRLSEGCATSTRGRGVLRDAGHPAGRVLHRVRGRDDGPAAAPRGGVGGGERAVEEFERAGRPAHGDRGPAAPRADRAAHGDLDAARTLADAAADAARQQRRAGWRDRAVLIGVESRLGSDAGRHRRARRGAARGGAPGAGRATCTAPSRRTWWPGGSRSRSTGRATRSDARPGGRPGARRAGARAASGAGWRGRWRAGRAATSRGAGRVPRRPARPGRATGRACRRSSCAPWRRATAPSSGRSGSGVVPGRRVARAGARVDGAHPGGRAARAGPPPSDVPMASRLAPRAPRPGTAAARAAVRRGRRTARRACPRDDWRAQASARAAQTSAAAAAAEARRAAAHGARRARRWSSSAGSRVGWWRSSSSRAARGSSSSAPRRTSRRSCGRSSSRCAGWPTRAVPPAADAARASADLRIAPAARRC